ncbi:MAG: hypothetical protein HY700_09355 [Gemmatimonadetes bacterium]|nr:hypothetical protein [Gemmatimonadota bacterium]
MRRIAVFAVMWLLCSTGAARAQVFTNVIPGVKTGGSANMKLLGHLTMDSVEKTADVTIEQELSRPYVYTAHRLTPSGVDAISIKDPTKPKIVWSWRIEDGMLHKGAGSLNPIYLKSKGRYYLTNAFQFATGGPNNDLGAVVWDVTGLPDSSKVREVARIYDKEHPGGFHESQAYKHSNGQSLLFTQAADLFANIYDIDKVAAGGDPAAWRVGRVPVPEQPNQPAGGGRSGYHDFYIQYDAANKRDVFYGAGAGGYTVYDVSDLSNPKLLTSVTGMSGVTRGHTFQVDPTGRYGVLETEYQYAPLRIVDLKPGLDGTVKTISRPIGAWNADWKDLAHNFAIRWPYVFTSAYEDGLQVFNMMDPTNPYTVGYYYTCECPHGVGAGGRGSVFSGAWGVEVRNADGLIALSDLTTGLWLLKMEGFDGWNGHQWGLPNNSSAIDWDNGPDGAPKAGKVS